MSSVTLFELEIGVVGRQTEALARTRLKEILSGPIEIEPLSLEAARLGAVVAAQSRAFGKQLSATDAMIAGHAAALSATLVTDDVRLAATVNELEVLRWR